MARTTKSSGAGKGKAAVASAKEKLEKLRLVFSPRGVSTSTILSMSSSSSTGSGSSTSSGSSASSSSSSSSSSPPPSAYLGFDVSGYPGDSLMQAWFHGSPPDNPPFRFVGFYLAPTPNHSDTGWMSKRAFLQGIGWGFMIVYVGYQDDNQNYSRGQTDGANAVSLASTAGFANGMIYLDREYRSAFGSDKLAYIQGWADYLNNSSSFKPGIYCSRLNADTIDGGVTGIARWWIAGTAGSPGCTVDTGSKTPADSGISYAGVWQYAISPTGVECQQTFNGYTLGLDLDMSYFPNPSAP